MNIAKKYPKIFSHLNDTKFVDEMRDLVVVDENFDDIDSDEFDVFDPEDYNFMIYITPRLQDTIGKEAMKTLVQKLAKVGEFESFYADDVDLYGVKSSLDEDGIAHFILMIFEKELL